MNKKALGLGLFALGVLIAIAAAVFSGGDEADPLTQAFRGRETTTLVAFIGGEKRQFVEDPKVQEILADAHGLKLDARKAGSIEMVTEPAILSQKPDLLWPGSQIAAEIGKLHGLKTLKDDIIFSTPIVLFSWAPIADALVRQGIAERVAGSDVAFRVNTRALAEKIRARAKWSDLGVADIYGTVMVFSTDPKRSNSGNQYATLLAMMLAGGDSDPGAIRAVLPDVAAIFRRMGYMEGSSFDLFEQYIRTGMTAKPIIAGYENQLIEFAAENPDIWKQVAGQPIRPVILYPEPTVFASHPALALTERGVRAVDALRDGKLLDIAWVRHGFRSGLAATADPSRLPFPGVPATVPQVIPSPSPAVVEEIVDAVSPRS